MVSPPRPLSASEQEAALHLWQEVFGAPSGYFERYYDGADVGYQEGDTLGVWDGAMLVSAVHLCRRPVVWAGGELLCGGIANVATLPDYRRQGLSRQLLARLIAKMEREEFRFSLLGTGTPGHYAALGWEMTHRPRASVKLSPVEPDADVVWEGVGPVAPLRGSYDAGPRPLQFLRFPSYFEGWVGWEWRRRSAQVASRPGCGYLVLDASAGPDQAAAVLEWRAVDAETELFLLKTAASEAGRRGCPELALETLPQHLGLGHLDSLGEVVRHVESDGMIRNIGLPLDLYHQVRECYRSGQAAWWSGDGF